MGEVEYVLDGIVGVKESVCATYVDSSGQKSLAAYVVPHNGASLDEGLVKRKVAEKLPEFMVPSQIIFLMSLPLSLNGKVDRSAFPPVRQNVAPTIAYEAPATEMERHLVEIWQSVLMRDAIGVNDNFFELGGHSVLALTLLSEMGRQLNIEFPYSRIMKCPTIRSFVLAFAREREGGLGRVS